MKELICIICPQSCRLTVDDNMQISGNKCPRGIPYVKKELTAPERVLTTTVAIDSEYIKRLPVTSDVAIPKELIFAALEKTRSIKVKVPVKCGQILIANVLGLKANIVATRSILK